MLRTPQLPPLVRATVFEYIEEKAAGAYGHSKVQRERFVSRLSIERVGPVPGSLAEYDGGKRRFGRAPRFGAHLPTNIE